MDCSISAEKNLQKVENWSCPLGCGVYSRVMLTCADCGSQQVDAHSCSSIQQAAGTYNKYFVAVHELQR